MTNKLIGKVAVITGGNSGIGLATAKRFYAEGAHVVITGRNQETLDAAVQEIGQDAVGIRSDTSNLGDIDDLFCQVKELHGHIDILFANAGVGTFLPIEDIDEATFDTMMNINVKGLYFTVQKALPLFHDGGAIVLNSSVASQLGFATTSVYSATKAAVRSLARTLSTELLGRNIRVNAVAPGPIETPLYYRLGLSEDAVGSTKEGFTSHVPMKRMGQVDEIANVALFLASDDSSYVLGEELVAGGGMTNL